MGVVKLVGTRQPRRGLFETAQGVGRGVFEVVAGFGVEGGVVGEWLM